MSLREQYGALCAEFAVERDQRVLDQLGVDGAEERLDLSGTSVTADQAALLSNLLSTSDQIQWLGFNDCLLSEDSFKALCLGLCLNTSVSTLELRGNNIRAAGTQHLATLLRKNRHITHLVLEWNNLGLCPVSFRQFADSLRHSGHLTSLDLRSNQLDQRCAGPLARALSANRTLTHLDVRWNGLGVIGGRALSEALQLNRTLTSCLVDGSAVPPDVARTIACRVKGNRELQDATQQKEAERSILTSQLREREVAGRRELGDVESTLQRERATFSSAQAELTFQLGQLQEALDERKSAVQQLSDRLSDTERQLGAASADRDRLQAELAVRDAELTSARATHQKVTSDHEETRRRLEAEQGRRCAELDAALAEERAGRLRAQTDADEQRALAETRAADVQRLQTALAALRHQMDAAAEAEAERRRQDAQEADQLRRAELARARDSCSGSLKQLQSQLRASDEQRAAVEAQLQQAGERQLAATRQHQQDAAALRRSLQQQQEDRCAALQSELERARAQLAEAARERHQADTAHQQTEANLRQSQLQARRRDAELQCLNKELELTRAEVPAAAARARAELQTELQQLETCRQQQRQAQTALAEARAELARRGEELEKEVRRRRDDMRKLRDELKRREAEIVRIREDELQRAALLHAAFRNYFRPAGGGAAVADPEDGRAPRLTAHESSASPGKQRRSGTAAARRRSSAAAAPLPEQSSSEDTSHG